MMMDRWKDGDDDDAGRGDDDDRVDDDDGCDDDDGSDGKQIMDRWMNRL